MDKMALFIGYTFMVVGGVGLLAWIVSDILNYVFRIQKIGVAFFLFMLQRQKEKRGKP